MSASLGTVLVTQINPEHLLMVMYFIFCVSALNTEGCGHPQHAQNSSPLGLNPLELEAIVCHVVSKLKSPLDLMHVGAVSKVCSLCVYLKLLEHCWKACVLGIATCPMHVHVRWYPPEPFGS